jgi:hypothetical protein
MNSFEVTSGALMASDPCYTSDVWCAGKIDNVKNGKWLSHVEISDEKIWGKRVASLQAWLFNSSPSNWTRVGGPNSGGPNFGVDSGQFGFFDYNYFINHESEREYDSPGFYKDCCDLTLSTDQFGAIDQGVVSSSGFGDGSYPVYIAKNANGEVIGVKVVFISDEEDEEDYYGEDEEC